MRLLDVLAARGEDVEDEAAARLEQLAGGAERRELLGLRLHVQERAEGADRERDTLADRRLAQVADAQVEPLGDTGHLGGGPGDREHLRRRVDPDHGDAGLGDRHRDASGADRELDDRPARRERAVDVEADVLGHRPAPGVVEARDPVVEGHADGLRATQTNSRLVLVERPPVEPAVERLGLEPGDVEQRLPTRRA